MKKKKIMKKILLILVAIFSVGVLAASADNEKLINKSKLPAQAQKFLDKHFADIDIVYAKEECNILLSSYEVRLANGAKIEFSNKGNWEEVDCQCHCAMARTHTRKVLSMATSTICSSRFMARRFLTTTCLTSTLPLNLSMTSQERQHSLS